MGRVPHTLSVLPDIPDIRTVIGVTAVVAVTCIIFVGLRSMGEWYGFVDKGITMEKLLVSVREVVESDESFVIQGRRPDSRRGRRCGRPTHARNTIVTSFAIRAI